jgi:hypothetical protein
MTAESLSAADSKRTAIVDLCDSWDIEVPEPDEIEFRQQSESKCLAEVPIQGEVLLDEILDTQGRLLGIKDGVGVELAGFKDTGLLLSLTVPGENS